LSLLSDSDNFFRCFSSTLANALYLPEGSKILSSGWHELPTVLSSAISQSVGFRFGGVSFLANVRFGSEAHVTARIYASNGNSEGVGVS